MRISANKDIRNYVKKLIDNGIAHLENGKKHAYLIMNGKRLTIPGTPSCSRSFVKFKCDVNRCSKSNLI